MNPELAARRSWQRLGLASREHVVLRGLSGLAGIQFLALVVWAGGDYHPLFSLALVGFIAVALLIPDSGAPLFLVLGLAALWAVSVPEALSWWTLLAALDLLVLHVACTLASYGPPQVVLGRRMFLLWGGRAALMAAVTALVWLAGRVLGALDLSATGLVTAAALAMLLGWTALLSVRLVTRDAA
jgi:hypothetical protein